MQTDSDGYLLVEKKFNSGGYIYEFVEQLDEDWCIYSVANPRNSNKIFDYELVRFTKHEEREIAGNKIAKKWFYPTANHFGKDGFSCRSLESAKRKHGEILNREKERQKVEEEIQLPVGKEFMVRDLAEKGASRTKLDLLIKSLGDKVTVVRLTKNKAGRDSKVLIYNP